jgi:molybdate transport system substrate-binding protein
MVGLLVGCGSDKAATPGTSSSSSPESSSSPVADGSVVVFAASSLTGAFSALGSAFTEANPKINVTFNFAGSSELVTQISQGAPADVFVSADTSNLQKLTDAGEVSGEAVSIARNTLQIIVEKGNPKKVVSVSDLAKPDLLVVLCAETVPCGKGAATVLKNARVSVTPRSLEDKVKGVVTKVVSGEADAGIVYVTDVQAAGDTAEGVAIPADVNVINEYPIVVTKHARNSAAARAFIAFAAGPAGQAILAKYGFLSP